MNKIVNQAIYIDERPESLDRVSSVNRPILRTLITGIMAAVIVGIFAPFAAGFIQKDAGPVANADPLPILCSGLGSNMEQNPWKATLSSYPNFDKSGREWTGQEAFSGNMKFVAYQGEGGKGQWLINETKGDRAKGYGNVSDEKVKKKLEETRGVSTCGPGSLMTGIANVTFAGSSSLAALVQSLATYAFDVGFICEDPQNPEGSCFNLAGIIGGAKGNDSGIIGALTSSIYLPLLVIVTTIAAFWVLREGIIKRRVRSAFFGALWVLIAVVLGVASLFNSQLIAKAPMTAASSVASCIIGSFNGENCFSGGSGESSTDVVKSEDICKSNANGLSLPEKTSMAVNGLNCSIWKAFVLEPYSQASFGMSYKDLDVKEGEISKTVKKSKIDPNTFCVNRKSSKSGESMENGVLNLDSGPTVCNLAIYQLYLMGDIKSGNDKAIPSGQDTPKIEDGIDKRWYNVVVVAANDDKVWSRWSGTPTSAIYKTMLSIFGGVTTLIGGIVILITAFLAMIYFIISVMLMALAPLFLLIGVHPGRGRDIFLGWLEVVVENIFKYMASAFFLIITIAFYGAVLGNVDNIGASMIFVLILTGALLLHRGEIINLIGKVNMGGQRMSGAFSEKVKSLGQSAAYAGAGAAGGMAAVGTRGKFSDYMKAGSSGAGDSIKRDLKRSHSGVGGMVGAVARQAERSSNDNRRDLKYKASQAESDSRTSASSFGDADAKYNSAASEFEATQNEMRRDRVDLDDLNVRAEVRNEAENKVLLGMSSNNSNFSDMQKVSNELRDVSMQHRTAVASGDQALASELYGRKEALQDKLGEASQNVSPTERMQGERRYGTLLRKEMENSGVSYTPEDEKRHGQVSERYAENASKYEDQRSKVNELAETRDQAQKTSREDSARADSMSESYVNWKPGQTLTQSKIKKAEDNAEKSASEVNLGNLSKSYDQPLSEFEESIRGKSNREGGDKDNRDIPDSEDRKPNQNQDRQPIPDEKPKPDRKPDTDKNQDKNEKPIPDRKTNQDRKPIPDEKPKSDRKPDSDRKNQRDEKPKPERKPRPEQNKRPIPDEKPKPDRKVNTPNQDEKTESLPIPRTEKPKKGSNGEKTPFQKEKEEGIDNLKDKIENMRDNNENNPFRK